MFSKEGGGGDKPPLEVIGVVPMIPKLLVCLKDSFMLVKTVLGECSYPPASQTQRVTLVELFRPLSIRSTSREK